MQCEKCGRDLTVWDVGFYKKLVNRGATAFCCMDCTCAHFRIGKDRAWEMIRRFRQTGCTLFPPEDGSR